MRRNVLSSWLLSVLVVAALVLAACPPPAVPFEPPATEITILHDTHTHGHFGPLDGVNMAHYVGLVNKLRTDRPHVLFLGNGDDLAPSLMSSMTRGAHMLGALNMAGLDFNTYGNHEFDFGPENLHAQVRRSEFQWVSANVLDRTTGDVFAAAAGAKRYDILEVAGVQIGITGFAPEETPAISSPGPDVVVLNPIEAAREVVPQMRADGAEIVIVLSHLAYPDAEELAAGVDGIDVIVGDHASDVLEQPKVINDTIVSRVGDEFDFLGELRLSVLDGSIVGWDFTLHEVTTDIRPAIGILTLVEAYEFQLEAALDEVIGVTEVALDGRREMVRSQETNLGNLIADVIREWADADVAVYNGGGIRGDELWEAGELTRRHALEILAFQNRLVKLELSGQDIWDALENAVSAVEEGSGRFLQVSGVSFVWDPEAEPGQRLVEVRIAGEPLDLEVSYTLATSEFLAGGGDHYDMFVDRPVLISRDDSPVDTVLLAEAVQRAGTIAPQVEGRITTVD